MPFFSNPLRRAGVGRETAVTDGRMNPELEARIAAHALLRGLVDASLFRAAAADPAGPVAHLMELGALDAEDVAVLEHLCAEGAEAEAAPPASSPSEPGAEPTRPHAVEGVWDSLPRVGESHDGTGRRVRQALTLPAWRQYRNLRFVAEGGMGRVFRAWDPSLKRAVALKFLRRDDPDLLRRFVLEAQHQARVEHPHIGRVYEVGEWEGQAYIAMQFVKGETLEQAAPKLSLEDKARVMERVAEAVHAAHREGLIHRDLKPANILVEAGEGDPRPVVVDFGLAKGLEPTGLTQQGLVIGTVHYMAPEQARGEHDQVGRRTDVYGLGATLHKVLTGQPPFAGAEGLDALRAALEDDVPSLHRLVPDLPEDLDLIVRTCLEKDPARRYESALAVAEDLRRWREGEPIRAQRPSLRYRTGKWARKHRLVVAVSGVALAALLGLAGYAGWLSWSAGARARHAQTFGQEAERIEALLRYAHLLPAHDIRAELDQARGRLRLLEAQAEQAGRLASGPAAYARGRAHLALGEIPQAKARLEEAWSGGLRTPEVALALGRVLAAEYRRAMTQAQALPSQELRQARERELARTLREPALARLREGAVAALEAPAFHEALVALMGGRWEEAEAKAREALEATPWLYEAKRMEGEALLERARAQGGHEVALALLARAEVALAEARRLAPSDPATAMGEVRVLEELARRGIASGRPPQASLARCRDAVARVGVLDPLNGEAAARLARALADLLTRISGRPPDAQDILEEALARSRDALSREPDSPAVLAARIPVLLIAVRQKGLGAGGRPEILEALRLAREASQRFPEDPLFPFMVVNACSRLVTVQKERGEPPGPTFEEGLAQATALRARYPDQGETYAKLASLWVERAEYERTHGQDPRPSVAAALEALTSAQGRGLRLRNPGWTWGDCHLIRGQYRVALGEDGEADLREAIRGYQRALQANPALDMAWAMQAEALLAMAEGRLDRGMNPAQAFAEARAVLARAEASASRAHQEGVLALLEGRARPGSGPDPRVDWARAAARFDAAYRETGEIRALVGLAEAHALSYRRGGRASDCTAALRAAEAIRSRDPRRPEGWLWMAVTERVAADRGIPGSGARAQEAWTRALALDANLQRRARLLGMP